MKERIKVQCRKCNGLFHLDWDNDQRHDVEIECPYCHFIEDEILKILLDHSGTFTYFTKEVYLNIPASQRFDPLGLSGKDYLGVQKRHVRTRLKSIEELDLEKRKGKDGILKKALREIEILFGRG